MKIFKIQNLGTYESFKKMFTTLRIFLYLERCTTAVVKISDVANVPFVKLYFH